MSNRNLGFVVICCLYSVCQSSALNAQIPINQADGVVSYAPRILQRILSEGERAIKESRFAEGITNLGMLFDSDNTDIPADIRGQDFFLADQSNIRTPPDGTLLHTRTLQGEALRLLGDLPPAGREILDLEYGLTARGLLDQALSEGTEAGVVDVARLYPFTDAGYDAQVIMAERALVRGSPLAAAAKFQELLDYPAARQRYGVSLARAAALAWLAAGLEDAAALALELAAQHFPGDSIQLGGQQITFSDTTNWAQVVGSAASFNRSRNAERTPVNWLTAGGGPDRSNVVDASMPIPSPYWTKKTHSSVPERNALIEYAEKQSQEANVLLPKMEIRAVGNSILAKANDGEILGIDLRTGLTKWAYYKNSAPADFLTPQFGGRNPYSLSRLSDQLKNRIWGSSAFGRFSCDSERFYYVTEGEVRSRRLNSGRTFTPVQRENQLQAASLQGEGLLLWIVGSNTEQESGNAGSNQLDGAYFLGPPLSYLGTLYCIVEINGEIRLVALDAENGGYLWGQQLCIPSMMQSDVVRKNQALSPTISDGVIVCPTGANSVAAVDLDSRRLRWLVTYPGSQEAMNRALGGAFLRGSAVNSLASRWHDNAVFVQDGRVVISPVESEDLLVRNVLTGQDIYRRRREAARYVAGLRDQDLFIVGEHNVYCVDMSNASIKWNCVFPEDWRLAGRGLWLKESLLIPLTDNRLIRVDCQNGSIVENVVTEVPLGNLFAHNGYLVSASATEVAVFPTREHLDAEIQLLLASNEGQTTAKILNLQSQLAHASGETDKAFTLLQESYQREPANIETRSMLVEMLMAGLEQDFAKYHAVATQLDQIVQDHPKRAMYLQLLARGSLEAGNLTDAFTHLVDFMRERLAQNRQVSSRRDSVLQLSGTHSINADAWVAVQLAHTYDAAGEAEQARMRESIMPLLDDLSGTILSQRIQTLRYFMWHPAAEEAILETAMRLAETEEYTFSERWLIPLLDSPNSQTREVALGLLANETPADVTRFSRNGSLIESMYAADGTLIQQPDTPPVEGGNRPTSWNRGVLEFRPIEQRTIYLTGNRLPLRSERFGRPEIALKLRNEELILQNGNGEVIQHIRLRRASSDSGTDFDRARLIGGLLLLETSSEILGIDIYRGLIDRMDAVLWRRSLVGADPGSAFEPVQQTAPETALGVAVNRRSAGVVGPLTPAGQILVLGDRIECVDPYTGDTIWTRAGYEQVSRVTYSDGELAIFDNRLRIIEFLNCRDGAEDLGRRREYEPTWQSWFSAYGLTVDYDEVRAEPSGVGNRIMSQRSKRPMIRIYDPHTDQTLLELRQLGLNSRAAVCENRYLVVADQADVLHYVDLKKRDYQQLLVPVDEYLESIRLERFQNHLVVMSKAEYAGHERQYLAEKNDATAKHEIHGSVYCIDTEKGSLAWSEPAKLYGMYFPLSQPRNSPFMIAYRFNPRIVNQRFQSQTQTCDLVLMDLRNGKAALAKRGQSIELNEGFEMELRPLLQSIELLLGDRSFRINVTDQPFAPRPIGRFGWIPAPADRNSTPLDLLLD